MPDTLQGNANHAQHEISQRVHRELKTDQDKSGGSLSMEVEQENRARVRLLRRYEVERRTGLSRSTIYAWMKEGKFPQPVKLGERIVAWRESDISAWLESRETRGL